MPKSALKLVSPDHFKSWERCPRQFYYKYAARLNWPSDHSRFDLGQDVHKLMDYQARGLDCAGILQGATPEVRVSWDKLMAHPITQLPVVANEWGFHLPVAGCWIAGRVDRIARDGDDVLIIDWKTGTGVPRQPETAWQTLIYLYAIVAAARDLGLENLQPEQVRFVYVEVKTDPRIPIREVVIAYDSARHAQNARHIEATLRAMTTAEDYPLPQACPDRFCQYRPVCGILSNS